MHRDGIAAALTGSLPALRRRAGWTQRELAERAGVSVRTIRSIERGTAGRLSAGTTDRLAAALKLRPVEPEQQVVTGGGLFIELLGPLRLWRDGALVEVRAPLQRSLLGLLALRARQPVLRDEIVELLWGARPPRSCLGLIHGYVGRLRGLLEPHRSRRGPALTIRSTAGGYLLEVPDKALDMDIFETLVAEADQDPGDPWRTEALLAQALRVWRGPVLADAEPRLRIHPVTVAAEHRRLTAALRYADAALALNHYDDAIAVLESLTHAEPLHEALHARLLLALAGAGRQAAALDRYARLRTRLRDELGVDPGPELVAAHLKLLRQQPQQDPAAHGLRPAQLPPRVASFTGRDDELARLDAMLAGDPAAPTVAVVTGSAGVGKTALAVHWAHRVRDRFPDGQLFVDLRGFGPGRQAFLPGEVARQFLEAFDVPSRRVPTTLDGQVALYRSLLADKRVLIVLDNARDADQVLPLLPGGSGCAVVVTSRSQLPGLVAQGAIPVTLELMSSVDARQLLARRLGSARAAAEPVAVDEIIDSCARLPLALVIVTARAAAHPDFRLAALAEELREQRGLDGFDTGEPGRDIRTVFSCSYEVLSPPAARLFRLFGLHRGPDVTSQAAASLAGVAVDRVRPLLIELARAHLVTEWAPGRYRMHDLLRAYSNECANETDSPADRQLALCRLLDHALHAAHAAALLVNRHLDPIGLGPAADGVTLPRFADNTEALSWLRTERHWLLTAVRQAAECGFDRHAWQLAWALTDNLDQSGRWLELYEAQSIGIAAARRLGDTLGQAHGNYGAARGAVQLTRHDDAERHYRQALALFKALDDRAGQGRTRIDLAWVLYRTGGHQQALTELTAAFALYQSVNRRDGQARAINNLGWAHAQLGNYRRAIVHCGMALRLHREFDNPYGQASALDTLGYAHHGLGNLPRAVACYEQALRMFRIDGDRYSEAGTLDRLGDTLRAAGDHERAGRVWRLALALLDELGLPDDGTIRAKLDNGPPPGDEPSRALVLDGPPNPEQPAVAGEPPLSLVASTPDR